MPDIAKTGRLVVTSVDMGSRDDGTIIRQTRIESNTDSCTELAQCLAQGEGAIALNEPVLCPVRYSTTLPPRLLSIIPDGAAALVVISRRLGITSQDIRLASQGFTDDRGNLRIFFDLQGPAVQALEANNMVVQMADHQAHFRLVNSSRGRRT